MPAPAGGPAAAAPVPAAVERALELARARLGDAVGRSGEPIVLHAEGTISILREVFGDEATQTAAALFGAGDAIPQAAIERDFGTDVAVLVEGIRQVMRLRELHLRASGSADGGQLETLRRMLLAMAVDIRVVVLRLASRLQTLRWHAAGRHLPEAGVSQETLDVLAPLANRLGLWQLKWELEDLSFRFLQPETYKALASELEEKRREREAFVATTIERLREMLAAEGVRAEVSGRPKHIYSIWNKMRRKQGGIDTLYDIRAVRILVDDVKDCYAALGVVHHLWTPLPREFDDYIAKPKANNYRSLHTAVIGPEEKALEVQIRTREMHQHSEYGVAAHWRYKEGGGAHAGRRDPAFEDRIAWLRQVLDWKDAAADASEWLSAFKSSLFTDTIYVLTPQGRVIDLPSGATPVDFAYAVHTNLGHRCRGARVDGAMVPLNSTLRNGQQVEIVTVREGGPSRDWLNAELGYVQSHRARAKVRQWFKAQQLDETVAHGRATVERELQRAGATALNLDNVAAKAGYAKADELFAAAGRDEINTRAIQMAIAAVAAPATAAAEAAADDTAEAITRRSRATGSGSGILIVGVDRLMTGLARCCKPAPPDAIVGFVTRGKGITIHRAACANVARARATQAERLITAEWGSAREEVFPVDIVVEASDRPGLLRDLSEVFSKERINVTAVNTLSRRDLARMNFTLEVKSVAELKRALAQVCEVTGVLSATRR